MRKLYIHKETKEVLHVSAFPETDLKDNVFEGTEVECITEHTEGFDWGDTWTPPPPPHVPTFDEKLYTTKKELFKALQEAHHEILCETLPDELTREQIEYILVNGIKPVGSHFWQRSQWNGTAWVYPSIPPYGVWEALNGTGYLKFEDNTGTPPSTGLEGGGAGGIATTSARWYGHVLAPRLYESPAFVLNKLTTSPTSRNNDGYTIHHNDISRYYDITSITSVSGGTFTPPSQYRWKIYERKA